MKLRRSFAPSLLFSLGLAVALPLALPPQPAQAKLFGLSVEDEIAAGKQVSKQALKQYGGAMPYNHPYSVRARTIGAQFARLSTRRDIPYSYTVLNDTKDLNAFAGPGGPIFITRRLMESVSNDAELAYVLGHETGHIELRHVAKQVEQQQKAGLLAGVLGAILGNNGNSDIVGTVANIGWSVVSSGYSRKDESEADAIGVRWMSQLGYDPRAAVSMLKKLDDGGKSSGLSKYLASHPDPKQREGAVQNQINAENLIAVAKEHGGPRLSSGLHPAVNANDTYGDDNGLPAVYPPAADQDGADDGEIDFGTPLQLSLLGDSGTGVVMAPVTGFARWAGATLSTEGDATTMRRGNATLRLRLNSVTAYYNGTAVKMSAPAHFSGRYLYAPLGNLAAAVGASASLDQKTRTVHLSLAGQGNGFVRVP